MQRDKLFINEIITETIEKRHQVLSLSIAVPLSPLSFTVTFVSFFHFHLFLSLSPLSFNPEPDFRPWLRGGRENWRAFLALSFSSSLRELV